jgi:hypothetical protein
MGRRSRTACTLVNALSSPLSGEFVQIWGGVAEVGYFVGDHVAGGVGLERRSGLIDRDTQHTPISGHGTYA